MPFKKLKDAIAAFCYMAILFIVKAIPAPRKKNHLLLIKTDEIGDYVLFHSYLKYFRQSAQYQHYKITMVGNGAWKQVFEHYDSNCGIDEVIWLDKKKLKKNFSYRFSVFKQVRMLGVSDVVNCIFSRSLLIDDGFAFVTRATNKVAMKGDNTNRGPGVSDWDGRIYTNVIDAGDCKVFDAVRNRNFISAILPDNAINVATSFPVAGTNNNLPHKYFVIFLGAGNPERKWPVTSFIQLAQYIQDKYGLVPVVCGGPDDKSDAAVFMAEYKGEAIDYVGKTTLLQMIDFLAGARLLVCVDTGILHIAAAVGCPVVGLYSGKFYGRFAPYPTEITKAFYPVYPDFVDVLIAKNDPVLYNTFVMKNDTIKMIQLAKVQDAVDTYMNA